MPTYRYRCGTCAEEIEVWQSMTDARLTVHEGDCGGALIRVMSPAGIVLKGSGFYKTDNRGKNGAGARRDAGKGDTKSESSSESKSESKGDSKSDSTSSSSSSSESSSSPSKSSSSTKAPTPA